VSESCVRPFHPADREAVFRIAADTAFYGAPVEAMLDDRRLFCDVFYRYYTDFEPERGWVAEVVEGGQARVVGFLMGSTDPARRQRAMRGLIANVAWRALGGGYRVGPKTWRYAFALLGQALRRELPAADPQRYPAHLHINLEAGWRGQGLGRGLMQAYLDQLRALGLPGVHLHTTSLNAAACRLYEKMGFQLLDARPTRLPAALGLGTFENRCYGRRLSTDGADARR